MNKHTDPTLIFSHNLSSLRKKQGWSQEALALKTNLSRQTVIKYEKGETDPSISTVKKFAKVLETPLDFFFRENTEFDDFKYGFKIKDFSGSMKNLNFREGDKLDEETSDVVKTQSFKKLMNLIELEDLLDSRIKFKNPIKHLQNIDSREKAERAALELRKKWCLYDNPFANVIGVLEREGIKVIEVEASTSFEGLSAMYDEMPVIVLNNAINETTRKRFTALHELGHLVLQITEDLDYAKVEKICDSFASMLILPKELLVSELGESRTKISLKELNLIKQKFGISIRAILVSARFAGIIDWDKYRYLCNSIESSNLSIIEYPYKEVALRFEQLLYRAVMEKKVDDKVYDRLALGKESSFFDLTAL